jgi:2-keto-4-pentenoate hydratase/2-oxohepta-3-ene-1,7-dioic acid hydratase in catechol pathway
MRIVRFGENRWGELAGDQVIATQGLAGKPSGEKFPRAELELLAPARPSKIVCVGRNYAAHIRELHGLGEELPKEPGLFLKGLNTLTGPDSLIPYPDFTDEFHYEGELAVVLKNRLYKASEAEAQQAILGYTCAFDLTARDKQRQDLQWVRAKSADLFCPLGPWLETDFDIAQAQLSTYLNGELRQQASFDQMIFKVPQILSYISGFMTLEAGDLVLTGTPEGVGTLSRGDRLELTITGIGTLAVSII